MKPQLQLKSRSIEEEQAYQDGYMEGFARSVQMQARVRTRRDQERVGQAAMQIQEFMRDIGFDKMDVVIRFVEEIGVLVIRK